MMLIKAYVAPSGIHGNGLFAGEDIKAGTRVWEFMEGLDSRIPIASLPLLPDVVRQYIMCYSYPHESDRSLLEMDGDHCRFMNHSEEHNVDFSPGRGHALRDIPAGAELTCNYRDFMPNFVPYGTASVLQGIPLGAVAESVAFTENVPAPA